MRWQADRMNDGMREAGTPMYWTMYTIPPLQPHLAVLQGTNFLAVPATVRTVCPPRPVPVAPSQRLMLSTASPPGSTQSPSPPPTV